MTVREPTADEVRGFLEFAGLSDNDAPLAVRALKVRLPGTLHQSTASQRLTCGTAYSKGTMMSTSWYWSSTMMRKRFVFIPGPLGGAQVLAQQTGLTSLQFRKKYSWDESAFSSGRDGTAGPDGLSCTCASCTHSLKTMTAAGLTRHQIAFHIESIPEESGSQVLHGVNPGQDTTYYGQTAPSRPPTRTMNRSPLGRAIDLTSASIPGNWQSEPLYDFD